jgi:dolichyl-diphosphooligosaccharide--protein glycosyltransferase
MVWWDYGHWVTRIGHRVPVSNPFQQGASTAGQFFTVQDEASANRKMDELDCRYVIIDHATVTGKFHTMATFADSIPDEFHEIYYEPQEGKLLPRLLFHPKYYQSIAIRLYNFDCREVAAKNPVVISYRQNISPEGESYKEITSSRSFPSYEEAKAYVSSQESGNYEIVGTNPFISPVPLDALEHYRLIYSSEDGIMQPGVGQVPLVKIFEYVK